MDPLIERLRTALADRYTILNELGAGGMATVYLAEDLKHRRKVAVKVLKPALAASLGVERFVREIEIAANLSHPHILPLFDSGEADGFLYYVMPHVQGESLRDRLERQGKLPVEEAVRFTDQIASALAYAHERGVVHRDIKPGNILLAGDQAIVADFGIARAVEAAGGPGLTVTGLAIGTPAYMSPEQALGTEAVDARTDVYALGCVVYEMVSGGLPFQGSTPQAVLAMQAADRVPSLRKSDPGIPVFLERAVARALATDPGDRFASAAEFAQALTTGTVVPRVRARRARQRVARALAGVAAVAVLVFGVWAVTKAREEPPIQRLAVLPLADLTNDPEQEYLVAGVHEALITELGRLGLSVTARATMARYRGTDKPIREIARELGVDAVIEGSLYRAGDSLEIAARLYGRDEEELWRGTYDGVLSNVLALYRGFARAIAGQIQLSLSPRDEARLAQAAPVNPGVYEAYLRGMHLLNNARTLDDFDQAIAHFNRAVEQNPADALAYAGMALAYVTMGHGAEPPPDVWPRARAAAERAIRLDSTLAEGWSALADYKSYGEHDWAGAEQAFRRANELNPSLAMNRYHYAWYLALFRRVDEAVAEHRRAQALDPLTPLHTVWIPALYWFSGEVEKALREARLVVEQFPNSPTAHWVLAESAARLGLYDEAIAAGERLFQLNPNWGARLGRMYAWAGRGEDALRIAREVEARGVTPWGASGLILLHAALGNREELSRWLTFELHHGTSAWYPSAGFLDAYLDDPAVQAFLRRANLQFRPGDPAPVPLPVVPTALAGDSVTGG